MTSEEYEQERVRWANSRPGTLIGYDCPRCMNRGYHAELRDGRAVDVPCQCMAIRRSQVHIRKSGLTDLMKRYTFDAYQTVESWQKAAKARAQQYAADASGWFVAAGSVGSGKTHLCTAICGELLRSGKEVRYMLWRDDGAKMKAVVNDKEEYSKLILPFKRADVLYIDDFWKGKEVTSGDINLAFELLNSRYNNTDKLTVISSEKMVEQIMDIDEAIGSRIYERSKGYYLRLTEKKNWRLK